MRYKLVELMDIIGGGTPRTTKAEYWNGTIPWLSVKDFNDDHRYVYTTEKSITELGLSSSATKLLYKDDIIISARGTVGELAMIPFPMAFNQSCYGLRAKRTVVEPVFLYYLLKYHIKSLKKNTHGSVFDTITRDTFSSIEVNIPTIEHQKQIAEILGSLDDKIELNNKINENLERQAEAIFKAWFIAFEPWNGKKPCEWVDAPLGSFVEIKRGGSPRPIQDFLSDTGLRWLKISDVTSLTSPYILDIKEHIKLEGLRKTVHLNAGELVLSNSATPGIPKILDVDSCIHDGWLYFPKSQLSKYWLYLFFKHIRQELILLGNGSIFTNLKTDILKAFPVTKADEKTLYAFEKLIKPLFETMLNADRESKRLTALRDALLPKLMSGEIQIL